MATHIKKESVGGPRHQSERERKRSLTNLRHQLMRNQSQVLLQRQVVVSLDKTLKNESKKQKLEHHHLFFLRQDRRCQKCSTVVVAAAEVTEVEGQTRWKETDEFLETKETTQQDQTTGQTST